MDLDSYQSSARRTINAALGERERLFDAAAGLAEEAGEVLGEIRKHLYQGRTLDRATLAEELGDALWCLSVVAGELGLSLDEVAASNLEKLQRRHPKGFDSNP
jgi:NTP pyrophosphatase (non-canonical NTP hydrolase)